MLIQSQLSWKIKPLVFCHCLAFFLVSTIFCPPLYKFFWASIDKGCYSFFSGLVVHSPFWQDFWALANHRIGDFIEDAFFVLFFVWLLQTTPRGKRLEKASEFLFLALLTAAVVLLVNNLLFKQLVHIKRLSPSLVLDSFPRLADLVSWIKVKSGAKACFPSDHATTAVMFIVDFLLLSRRKSLTLAVCLYGAFLCCPRMVAGAHWLTDILCGSLSVVLVVFSWALYTPFAAFSIRNIHKAAVKTSHFFGKFRKQPASI